MASKILYIEGTSGVGKTTCIKKIAKLHGSKVETHMIDFFNLIEDFKPYLDKASNDSINVGYCIDLGIRISSALGKTPNDKHALFDRGVISTLLYSIIFKKLDCKYEIDWEQEIKSVISGQALESLKKEGNVLVVLCPDEQIEEILDRMRKRDNGIDLLNERYILLQNGAFAAFAVLCDYPVMKPNHPDEIYKRVCDILSLNC